MILESWRNKRAKSFKPITVLSLGALSRDAEDVPFLSWLCSDFLLSATKYHFIFVHWMLNKNNTCRRSIWTSEQVLCMCWSCHPGITVHYSPWFSRRNAWRDCYRPNMMEVGLVDATWRTSWDPISIWETVELPGIDRRQRPRYVTRSFRALRHARSCHPRP